MYWLSWNILLSIFSGPTAFPEMSCFNTSDTSINVSWVHIPEHEWGDIPGGYVIQLTPPRENAGPFDETNLM